MILALSNARRNSGKWKAEFDQSCQNSFNNEYNYMMESLKRSTIICCCFVSRVESDHGPTFQALRLSLANFREHEKKRYFGSLVLKIVIAACLSYF